MTMLDLDQEPNQRTHHILRAMAEVSAETVLVTKVKTLDRSLRAFASDALRWSIAERREGTMRILRLHPFLNYAQAMAAGLVQGQMLVNRAEQGVRQTASPIQPDPRVKDEMWFSRDA